MDDSDLIVNVTEQKIALLRKRNELQAQLKEAEDGYEINQMRRTMEELKEKLPTAIVEMQLAECENKVITEQGKKLRVVCEANIALLENLRATLHRRAEEEIHSAHATAAMDYRIEALQQEIEEERQKLQDAKLRLAEGRGRVEAMRIFFEKEKPFN